MTRSRLTKLSSIAILMTIAVTDSDAWRPAVKSPMVTPFRGAGRVVLGPGAGGAQKVINGKHTPELISDNIAFRHFLSAATVPPKASADDYVLQSIQIDRVGLSEADRKVFLTIVQPVRARLSASIVKEPNVVDDTIEQLRMRLTPNGFDLLEAHVRNYVKPRITIYFAEQ